MKKTIKLLKVLSGFTSAAGLFGIAILGCVAYGVKNGTIDKPLIKKEENKEESGR